jgi:hypothetical protein
VFRNKQTILLFIFISIHSGGKSQVQSYKGKPWNDIVQEIPGKIQCEWYDVGGEGIAYHDADSINNGSGKLNPSNGYYLNEFRMLDGVDISYTKSNGIDDNPFNLVEPRMGELYVGWTKPGEWLNYTILVNKTGTYALALMYTASGDGQVNLILDKKKTIAELMIPSTRNVKENISWRQWHHWNRIEFPSKIFLQKGTHILTLKTELNGNMNYDYLEFRLLSP